MAGRAAINQVSMFRDVVRDSEDGGIFEPDRNDGVARTSAAHFYHSCPFREGCPLASQNIQDQVWRGSPWGRCLEFAGSGPGPRLKWRRQAGGGEQFYSRPAC